MKMTQEELTKIIENHRHWLIEDCINWTTLYANLREADLTRANLMEADLTRANLMEADLTGANLAGAKLRKANLTGAELRKAILTRADLTGAELFEANLFEAYLFEANLTGADLTRANLMEADLMEANLTGAELRKADLTGANLREADLTGAELRKANLTGANLTGANLTGANLTGANINDKYLNIAYPIHCPEYGSFIGWKKADDNLIVKLEILEDAKRSSAFGRKCRCDKARVLAIENLNGSKSEVTEVASRFKSDFIYRLGEIVKVDDFCEDRKEECAEGIHFFITRSEAVFYGM